MTEVLWLKLASLLAAVAAVAAFRLRRLAARDRRGRELVRERALRRRREPRRPGVSWGGVMLPAGAETTHFLVAGTTGSGKSLTLNRLMAEAIGPAAGPDTRALVYDPKTEVMSTLASIGSELPVVTMSPFDKRGAQWDMAADVTSPVTALQVAANFIPADSGQNRYFSDAARDLMTKVMLTLVQSRADWTLRDVLLAMMSAADLEALLSMSEAGRRAFEMHAGDARTFSNVLSTAQTWLAPLEPIAALWAEAETRVSLREWSTGRMVLVLGNDDSARAAVDAVNRVLFQRATELALKLPNSFTRRTWFFLDEVREAGRLDGLSRLLNKGRSKGCCVALGFQDIHGMKEVYGEEVALELVGQCSQKAILRLETGETAKWGADQIGQYEEVELLQSEQRGGASEGARSVSEHRRSADLVTPGEIRALPPTSKKRGLTGYYLTPHVGAFKRTLSVRSLLKGQGGRESRVLEERGEAQQYLQEWSPEERARLKLEGGELSRALEPETGRVEQLARALRSEAA